MKKNMLSVGVKLFATFVVIFTLSSALFYFATKNLKVDIGYVGAYINLLAFDATLFAALTAYILVDSWKKQHNTSKISHYAEVAWKVLSLENDLINSTKYAFEKDTFDDTFFKSKTYRNFEEMYLKIHSNLADVCFCIEMIGSANEGDERKKELKSFTRRLQSKFRACFSPDNRESAKQDVLNILDEQIKRNENLKIYLKDLIILKVL